MAKRFVIGICLTDTVENAPELQKILTECGRYIKTRLGFHETSENLCSTSGLILLEVYGGDEAVAALETKLKTIKGIQIQKMVFDV